MPVRRGLVAPRTTLIETIIRKFDTDSEYIVHPNFIVIFSYGVSNTISYVKSFTNLSLLEGGVTDLQKVLTC